MGTPTAYNTNLWSLPGIWLTDDERREDSELSYLLASGMASEIASKLPRNLYRVHQVDKVFLFPNLDNTDDKINLNCKLLLVSFRTKRIMFIDRKCQCVFQRRMAHLNPPV
ncbi:hypothetical protein E1B28_001556 [Marasmius oreades]|uniref:Uncharacterized protein n=1 Tax=Marasmius oreades TaxID=181124 RepID=A0A9P7V3M5_9AGAR|nr:uncharacterized protein E1B28_001556 [Marasmius oreades]KAG7099741.1 hypothetical protein E1B28_001556 [Marasmius oreades]